MGALNKPTCYTQWSLAGFTAENDSVSSPASCHLQAAWDEVEVEVRENDKPSGVYPHPSLVNSLVHSLSASDKSLGI